MADTTGEYDRFIDPIEERIIKCIWGIVRDQHDAEDALQDLLAKIWRRRKKIFSHPNVTAVVLRMSANSAYDVLRRRIRQRARAARGAPVAEWQSHAPRPIEAMVEREQRRQVLQAISRLSRKQAAAVLMRLVDEMPYSQIASALRCSETTARVHVQRGRERLRTRLAHLNPMTSRGEA